MKFRFGLLPRVVLAIGLGVGCGFFFPEWATRIALTFNDIFGQFLSFVIPLLILGLVAPGIADLWDGRVMCYAVTASLWCSSFLPVSGGHGRGSSCHFRHRLGCGAVRFRDIFRDLRRRRDLRPCRHAGTAGAAVLFLALLCKAVSGSSRIRSQGKNKTGAKGTVLQS